ncbi:hypothetical protein EPI10_031382 [Gossypium australe]|uniref:Uncharacterized protein n=1 Tax=Gossypium australe TaxID=47621 RepID=A0A5B6X3K2_9ROSI|nr:hypothetical protein EPI10_031382 [Gossypium australe]
MNMLMYYAKDHVDELIIKATEGSGVIEDHHHTIKLYFGMTLKWVANWPCKWPIFADTVEHTGVSLDLVP